MGSSSFSADCSRGFLGFASSRIDPMRQLKMLIVVAGDDDLLVWIFRV
jgi:hypothetical protein